MKLPFLLYNCLSRFKMQNYMMSTSELKKTIQNKRLLTKKDLLKIAVNDPDLNSGDELKQMKVDELRNHFKITHEINGNLKDMRGHCLIGCLASLRHDYTSNLNKNYCLDCL